MPLCFAAVALALLPPSLGLDLPKPNDLERVATALERVRPSARDVFNLDGGAIDPFLANVGRLKVFFFVDTECPISNRYAPEVRRYCDQFGPQGVDFSLVYCDADTTADMIRNHMKEFSYHCAGLRDPKHELARKGRVQVTPECAVFTGSGKLVYHGRIDNRYADFGKVRPHPTRHELQDAIEAALLGRAPICISMGAVGCRIPDLP